jgi:predicted nucleic acid-binding protein
LSPLAADREDRIVDKRVKGPASYFPSIEKKYGRPIGEWKAMIRASDLTKHMELVQWLKAEHGLGHGHANALVADTLAEDSDGNTTKFVVDCGVVLQLASEELEVPAEHELLAPTLLRSQTLSALHEAVHAGEIAPDVASDRLTRVWAMPIRLLGDAVLRRRAWELAEQLGWASTYDAEYVALTQLQADAFVTLDAELARRVDGVVSTATIEALRTA